MIHVFTPVKNKMSPSGCLDSYPTRVKAGDTVLISVVFTWDKDLAESMGKFYRSIGAKVKIEGPAYDDAGGEFTPGLFMASGVVITHRGCVRNCPWCYVPRREGQKIRCLEVKEGNILQDNNILACPRSHKEKVWEMLRTQRQVSLRGGLDARLLKDEDVENIRSLRLFDLWTAYDSRDNKKSIETIEKFRRAGIPQSKIRVYVMVGFDGEMMSEATERLVEVYKAGGLPFAQLFDGYKGSDILEWKRFARRWCLPAIYKSFFGVNRAGKVFFRF